jgi:hypothetical protein
MACCAVQDVGLIFLSAMATSCAEIGQEVGLNTAEVVGTAMLTLTVATTLVGIMTWLVGESAVTASTSSRHAGFRVGC